MPEQNSESYKEMYEMGERLMEMAKQGGYDPESGESEEREGYSEESESSSGSDNVSKALKFFK